jgi:radical SAM protein with 4Fe4S-binding SPASM domain
MREIRYRKFSLQTHKKGWSLKRPNTCQFELTFRCGLHCKHCYTDCYNRPAYFAKELTTKQIKLILDKIYDSGVIWICFTGGDPFIRKDFLKIYKYAKKKGFLVSIFTSGYSITEEIIRDLKKSPPFVIELTLNSVTKDLYERISQVRGSFRKAMQAIEMIVDAKIPLKIKTQVTNDNLKELNAIKSFAKDKKINFVPDYYLYPRLDGDSAPCALRITPKEIIKLGVKLPLDCLTRFRKKNNHLFRCAVDSGDGFNVDPYGNIFPCLAIREPKFSLFKYSIASAMGKTAFFLRNSLFKDNSKCKICKDKQSCYWCPGKAYLEKGQMGVPIEYYCELTKELTGLVGERINDREEGQLLLASVM